MERESETRRRRIDPKLEAAGWRVVSSATVTHTPPDSPSALVELSTGAGSADQLLDPSPRIRDRYRVTDQPPLAISQPHPMRDLARIDRHDNTIALELSEQPRHQTPPHTEDQRERPTPNQEQASTQHGAP